MSGRVEDRVWDPSYEDCLYVEEEPDGTLTLTLSADREDRISLDLDSVRRLRRALARFERKATP